MAVAVSIGVAQGRPATGDADELLRNADFAMYMAKGGGKGRSELFDAPLREGSGDRSALRNDLAVAVTGDQLRLDYQPVADLQTAEVLGVEALVRWQHPTLGRLLPDDFISLPEETGHIDAIGCLVLEQAARQMATWRATVPHCSDLWDSVNLSPFRRRHRGSGPAGAAPQPRLPAGTGIPAGPARERAGDGGAARRRRPTAATAMAG